MKSWFMVGAGKEIVLRNEQCFLVQPTKLTLPDLPSKFKILQLNQFIENNFFLKKNKKFIQKNDKTFKM